MAKPRFAVTVLKETRRYKGSITFADLCRAFRIPERATVSIQAPSGGDCSGMKLTMGAKGSDEDFSEIAVDWEEVT